MGGDLQHSRHCIAYNKIFQSTPPVWVVTTGEIEKQLYDIISIHTTRVGGDYQQEYYIVSISISIHTTRVGGDEIIKQYYDLFRISIHTTRVGGDRTVQTYALIRVNFNPHHPCGW